jgi:hypothetical protein
MRTPTRKTPAGACDTHMHIFLEPVGVEHPGVRTLLKLLDSGRC